MATDPKLILRRVTTGMTVNIDDDATAASICWMYAAGRDTMKELFQTDDYDVVITIGDGRYQTSREIQDVPSYQATIYPVSICTIDKFDTDTTTLLATSQEMQWKLRENFQDTIEAAAQGTQYTITNPNGQPNHMKIGGLQMHCFTYDVLYKISQ